MLGKKDSHCRRSEHEALRDGLTQREWEEESKYGTNKAVNAPAQSRCGGSLIWCLAATATTHKQAQGDEVEGDAPEDSAAAGEGHDQHEQRHPISQRI